MRTITAPTYTTGKILRQKITHWKWEWKQEMEWKGGNARHTEKELQFVEETTHLCQLCLLFHTETSDYLFLYSPFPTITSSAFCFAISTHLYTTVCVLLFPSSSFSTMSSFNCSPWSVSSSLSSSAHSLLTFCPRGETREVCKITETSHSRIFTPAGLHTSSRWVHIYGSLTTKCNKATTTEKSPKE